MYKWPERKSLRMKSFDYSENGYYFVTICTKNRENKFGEIIWTEMVLNEYGKIVEKCWYEIVNHHNVEIDYFVVMPNHVHLIIVIRNVTIFDICNFVGNAGPHSLRGNGFTKNNLSNAIQRIKSSITLNIRKNFNDFTFSWQKSFYDRIIRNEKELLEIRKYIEENPLKWHLDKNNLL